MKKILALLLVLLLVVGTLTACGNKTNTSNSNDKKVEVTDKKEDPVEKPEDTKPEESNEGGTILDDILKAGKIVVGTSPDFAPAEFLDISKTGMDQYVGIDMDFARYIAKELGVELEIKPMDFGALITAVNAGNVDLILSGFAWREERAEAMELTDFYNIEDDENGQGILILKADADKYKTAADFAGKTVAVQETSLQYALLEEQIPDAIPKPITSINDGVLMLMSNKVDAVGVSSDNGLSIINNYPDVLQLSDFYYDYSSEGNVGGIKKGETNFLAKINEIVKKANDANLFPKWRQDANDLAASIGWQN